MQFPVQTWASSLTNISRFMSLLMRTQTISGFRSWGFARCSWTNWQRRWTASTTVATPMYEQLLLSSLTCSAGCILSYLTLINSNIFKVLGTILTPWSTMPENHHVFSSIKLVQWLLSIGELKTQALISNSLYLKWCYLMPQCKTMQI